MGCETRTKNKGRHSNIHERDSVNAIELSTILYYTTVRVLRVQMHPYIHGFADVTVCRDQQRLRHCFLPNMTSTQMDFFRHS